MRALRQLLVAASSLALLVAVLGVISDAPASAAKTNDVTVVNTPAEAVPTVVTNTPLPVQGTVNANITNSTVPVSLSNTGATPLFVDGENSSRAGIGAQCDAPFDSTGFAACKIADVPAGQILVIETVTCAASVAGGTPVVPIVLNMGSPAIGGGGPINLNHRLPLTRTASISGGLDYYGFTSEVRMYAVADSAGVNVFTGVGPGSANQGDLTCAISGHMASQ